VLKNWRPCQLRSSGLSLLQFKAGVEDCRGRQLLVEALSEWVSDVRRRGVLANVLDSHKSSVDEPAVSGNILVTIWVDVAHLATGVADGLGVGLGLPTGVTAALLSEARSRDARGVGTGLIARVVV